MTIKIQLVIFLNILLYSLTFSSKALTIVARLKPNQRITFFYGGTKMCRLFNNSNRDTLMIAKVDIRTVTEFRYGVAFQKDNKFVNIRNTMLVTPNDSLVFERNGNELIPINKAAKSIFLNQHIEAGSYSLDENPTKTEGVDFNWFLRNQKEKFDIDSIKIDSLCQHHVIDEEQKSRWTNFRKIYFMATLFRFMGNKQEPKTGNITDKLFYEAIGYFKQHNLDGDLADETLTWLIAYWINKDNNSHSKPVDFYLNFRSTINKAYIQTYFVRYLKNTEDKSTPVYKKNKEKIKGYAVKYDPKILEEIEALGQKEVFNISEVSLLNADNKKLNLSDIIEKSQKDYVLLDLWASWCGPCKQQMPYLEKIKKGFQSRNIVFISISTDKKQSDWLKSTRPSGLNFRLPEGSISTLTKFFKVDAIPRYIVLNKDGVVLYDRFYIPTDKKFTTSLLKILEQKAIGKIN